MKKRNIKIIKKSSRIATGMFAVLCAGIFAGCSLPSEPEEKHEEYQNNQVFEEFGLEENQIIEIEKSVPGQNQAETECEDIQTITVAEKEKEDRERTEKKEKEETKEKKETEEKKVTEVQEETKTEAYKITGTFSRNEGGVVVYPAYQRADGQQVMIELDMNSQLPVWDGYESDVLHIVGLEEEKYRITGAAWAGEAYWGVETNQETNKEEAVEYRDVVYSYEQR